MPNNFGGSQLDPEYTGAKPRARTKYQCVCDGELFEYTGNGLVEVERPYGFVVRFKLNDEDLPERVRKKFAGLT